MSDTSRSYNFISGWVLVLTILSTIQLLLFASNKINTDEYSANLRNKSLKSEDPYKIDDSALLRPKRKDQPFNYTNPHFDSWCPHAKCYNSPLCTPCNRRFLFIIATGRSGSTTLLRMFHELPGVRLAGENFNELYIASQLYTNLEKDNHFSNEKWIAKGRYTQTKMDGAFQHNALPIGTLSCVTQSLVEMLDPPELSEDTFEMEDDSRTILGMKVIRLQKGNWSPSQAAKFLRDSFPCGRFIINIRSDIEAQIESVKSNFHYNVSTDKINSENDFLLKLKDELGHSAIKIDMTYWKDNVKNLNHVLDWLGFEDCAFNTIVHENHDGYLVDKTSKLNVGEKCRYPHF